jgi:hypothetical protein
VQLLQAARLADVDGKTSKSFGQALVGGTIVTFLIDSDDDGWFFRQPMPHGLIAGPNR